MGGGGSGLCVGRGGGERGSGLCVWWVGIFLLYLFFQFLEGELAFLSGATSQLDKVNIL